MDTSDEMVEGPQPLLQMKPAKRRPNGADRFQQHHDDYEARGSRSRDHGALDVRQTHCTYPTLTSELRKKRSIANVKALSNKYRNIRRQYCPECAKFEMSKLKKKQKEKNLHRKRNFRTRTKDDHKKLGFEKGKEKSSKVRRKSNSLCNKCRLIYRKTPIYIVKSTNVLDDLGIKTSFDVQKHIYKKMKEIEIKSEEKLAGDNASHCSDNKKCKNNRKDASKSENGSIYSSSVKKIYSNPSMNSRSCSRHSFASIGHEPMVFE